MIDILGLGAATVDDILYVEAYPAADSKLQILGRQRHLGGLTATALVTAARLGCQVAYAGLLGHDAASEEIAQGLQQQGVDLTHVVWRDEAHPIEAVIIADQRTRTIFFDASHPCGADLELPEPEVIRSARVLFVDHLGVEGMVRAARIASAAKIPIVADLESDRSPRLPDLLDLVDHLIVSYRFAIKLVGDVSPPVAAERLWTDDRRAVVITCGAEGAWYLTGPDRPAQHQPAFAVKVVDSTGCGDVFHGAYAAGLVFGMHIAERVRFAAAAAAIKATQPGGQLGIPDRATVESFLRQRS